MIDRSDCYRLLGEYDKAIEDSQKLIDLEHQVGEDLKRLALIGKGEVKVEHAGFDAYEQENIELPEWYKLWM